jgi:hypothetical protein
LQDSAVIGFWMNGEKYDKAQELFEKVLEAQRKLKE